MFEGPTPIIKVIIHDNTSSSDLSENMVQNCDKAYRQHGYTHTKGNDKSFSIMETDSVDTLKYLNGCFVLGVALKGHFFFTMLTTSIMI